MKNLEQGLPRRFAGTALNPGCISSDEPPSPRIWLRWLEKRRDELLPVGYFHVVFTLPHELHPLIRANVRVMVRLLFQAAAATLLDFARSRWNARLGILAVLHTWDQRLLEHYHADGREAMKD